MYLARASIRLLLAGLVATGAAGAALPQSAPGGPPAVGIVEATRRPITETSEFLGRIEAINRVNVVARVTGFLECAPVRGGRRDQEGGSTLPSRAGSL
jgi:membrane fusion protein (multidrug efflux system)